MVSVAQLVEPRIVIPVVVGSSPIVHPINYLYMFLFSSKAFYPERSRGDAVLWDGTVPHCRKKSKGKIREAVIFSLSRSLEFSKSYLNVEDSLLARYIKAMS